MSEDLLANLPPRGRLLGLDVGDKTVGVAASDSGRAIASPVDTIRRSKIASDAAALKVLIGQRGAVGLVIGLPINMDGSEGPRCQSVRAFARNMAAQGIALPVAFWDERLSTAAVERFLIGEVDMTRARRDRVVDKMAAAYILQGALDALRRRAAAADTPA